MTHAVFSDLMPSTVSIAQEAPADMAGREALLEAALGPARHRKTSARLRAGRLPAEGLAFTAHDGIHVVGTIRLWHIIAGGVPALLLGPLAVAKSHEGQGLGSRLMRRALAEAAFRGHAAVILVGDAPYYQRFGFSRSLTENLILPGPVEPDRFLGLELKPGALSDACGLVVAAGERAPAANRAARSQSGSRDRLERKAA
ncbi:MAG: N-acetyltransferase [Methylocystis sp.]|nr:N-acetyltransferase [Methylocystis sp.]MCA3583449.1 N-acetyltransferase [Methylocystis sp.]MCA3587411.1 N-acetyltransferase [Methylocystis sp.]MCA3592744.1 N-acetyltransferase [Methylocystis sp.]